jgi:nucleolar protein 14
MSSLPREVLRCVEGKEKESQSTPKVDPVCVLFHAQGKPKSRKEVMDELIAKSKFYKAQKAKEKEETDELLGALDEQFKELTQQKLLNSKPSKKDNLAGLMAKYGVASESKGGEIAVRKGSGELANGKKVKEAGKGGEGSEVRKEERDDYEKLAREMASEIRARASDRTKDPEEVAKEERERLEKLEKKRKQRMEGNHSASSFFQNWVSG